MAINIITDLVDSDADGIITEGGGGGGLSNGDKGDIIVAGGGSSLTIDNGVVTTAKMGGDVTAAGKALLDDADASAQRTTLGLGSAATHPSTDFANASHSHAEADVTGLVADLAGKAAVSHTHAEADVTGLVADLAGKQPLSTGLTMLSSVKHVIDADLTIPAGYGAYIPRYLEIGAGVTLEIGAGADLEIG